jgi:hypothetical protein
MPSRPTMPPHSGTVTNSKTFATAYRMIQEHSESIYTTAFGTRFTVEARLIQKGHHKRQKVIIFKQDGKEMARAYECCWGHKTNCNRTYIDSYSPNI